jgi:hypothetical protein
MPISSAAPSSSARKTCAADGGAQEQHRGERPPQPLLLKIETGLAVRNLPRLIVQAGRISPSR